MCSFKGGVPSYFRTINSGLIFQEPQLCTYIYSTTELGHYCPVVHFVSVFQADSNSLKNFLSAARLADRGSETGSLPLSTLTPVRARDVEQPKKKLTVLSKKDYPLTSSFPYSLEHLQVSWCKLSRVDMRMLSLKGKGTFFLLQLWTYCI